MFSECKISRASSTNIHLQMIPLMYLPPKKLQCSREYKGIQGNTRILKQFTKVSLHISTVHWCNWNNKFWVKTTYLFLEWYQSPRACSYIFIVTNCCYSCYHRTRLKDGEICCYLTFALYRNWKLERLRWRGQRLSQMTKKQNGGKWSFFPLCRVKRVGRRKSVMTWDQFCIQKLFLGAFSCHQIF